MSADDGPAGPSRLLVLWSVPRARSTVFFKMMAERGDFLAVHEPFSNLAEFGCVRVDGRVLGTQGSVLAALRDAAGRRPVFVKDTTDERYTDVLADERFLASDARHTFLIRHPRETIASYHALNPDVSCHQIGFAALHEVFTAVCQATGRTPLVIDSSDLVANPAGVVRGYCAANFIDFRPAALNWRPGPRPEWRPTGRWHVRASTTGGFEPTGTDYDLDVMSHPVLGGYLRHHLPFYEELRPHRLIPDG
jgi:Sulfotransferase domain